MDHAENKFFSLTIKCASRFDQSGASHRLLVLAHRLASAIAGAIGAGGLGDIAYRYGYQRFDSQIMLMMIVLLVALVAVIQLGGDRLARGLNKPKRMTFCGEVACSIATKRDCSTYKKIVPNVVTNAAHE